MKKNQSHMSNKANVSTSVQVGMRDSHASSHKSQPVVRKILTWLGWGLVYVFVFYLGNVTGEYVAAHLPIIPTVSVNISALKKLIPNVNLPRISMEWKWPMGTTRTKSVVARTKLVVIRGNFINMPLDGATADEQKQFVDKVQSMSVESKDISLSQACEANPAFIRVKKGTELAVTNTSSNDRSLQFNGVAKTVAAKQKVSIPLIENEGVYALSCDGSIVGFYHVY